MAKQKRKAQPTDCTGIFIDPDKLPKPDGEGWETGSGERFSLTFAADTAPAESDKDEPLRVRIVYTAGEIREDDLPEMPAYLITKPPRLNFLQRVKLAWQAAKMILTYK